MNTTKTTELLNDPYDLQYIGRVIVKSIIEKQKQEKLDHLSTEEIATLCLLSIDKYLNDLF